MRATTLVTIIAFGVLTLFLHDEFLRGDRAAGALAGFIAIFLELCESVVDATYLHTFGLAKRAFSLSWDCLLTSAIRALALTYWAVGCGA